MAPDLTAFFQQNAKHLPVSPWKLACWLGLPYIAYRFNRYLSYRALNNGVVDNFDWEKEIILITGGSNGIGAACVQKLASKGTQVVVLDILPLSYDSPKNLHYYRCDLTNFDEVQAVAATVTREVGAPTCVVANAGICRGKSLLQATKRDVELTFGVNSLGLLWTIKTFLPSLTAKNHGHFVILASQTGHLATAGVVDYAATKAAALAIYEGLQTELRHIYKAPAVRVSCVSPSAVTTKMFRGIKLPSSVQPLQPSDVGSAIAEILWSGRAQNIMLPASAYISPITRALPDWLRIGLQEFGKDVMTDLDPHKPLD
ncbi:short-chain dehydrogenase, putative [Talaromyces stipitatus ATCC 10500]|uniref:Short-chain dehydrogenase, putative n=1 Tax=Talaromyces stipitatus (strain ATCC 10500 / CBS 375.48 / QM 6759 / NRRL 1006) TaxID=441959 RepID=B8MPJ6_TALSN|nr:short-chain dehydrogenase, putative [Talaromyces stipitatus ATCC 10500]EED14435.1 short-chain dehydrogenase, putative [Talaromyces stipitatus ATCC 10500]